jgi:Fic family protein
MSQGPAIVAAYDAPHQFEPLLPRDQVAAGLREQADELARQALRLQGGIHPTTLATLRELVRAMNSYYSNRIEGQSTHPLNIAKALQANFAAQPDVARRQRIAVAHIQAEAALEQRVVEGQNPLTSTFAIQAHRELYERLAPEDRTSDEGVVVAPGDVRSQDVQVYRHQPPTFTSLPRFLARFDEVYASRRWALSDLPWAVACAHHRLAWVHPFLDGNGRAVRLQTHAALWRLSAGLWSVNRGLARRRDDYYRLLSEADMARQGDLDGRGNLSERTLLAWCQFFLEVCTDQAAFMSRMLDLPHMKLRIGQLVAARSRLPGKDKTYRPEVELPLYHVFVAGPVTRGEFQQMTGLAQRTAVRVLGGLLDDGIVLSESRHAPVRFGLPLDALHLLLPGLYPEAAAPVEDA